MRRLITGLIVLAALAGSALAAPQFPALSGRVMDDANILSPATEQTLSNNLEAFEQKTRHQLVVVTVPSLGGLEIEEYGYQLGRHWGIGRKGADDGALLLVAPTERRVRIEVGYGLEGELTDAQSSQIIQTVILPEFRRGNWETGVVNGTRATISVLGGEPFAMPQIATQQGEEIPLWLVILFVAVIIFVRLRFGVLLIPIGGYGRGWSGGSGGTSSGGHRFGGGGGSFGGGGSTGRW